MILSGEGLCVRYPGVERAALDRVRVSLEPGELVAIVRSLRSPPLASG